MSDCEDYYFTDSDEDHQFPEDVDEGDDNYNNDNEEEHEPHAENITKTKPNASSNAKSVDEHDVIQCMNEIIQSI